MGPLRNLVSEFQPSFGRSGRAFSLDCPRWMIRTVITRRFWMSFIVADSLIP